MESSHRRTEGGIGATVAAFSLPSRQCALAPQASRFGLVQLSFPCFDLSLLEDSSFFQQGWPLSRTGVVSSQASVGPWHTSQTMSLCLSVPCASAAASGAMSGQH